MNNFIQILQNSENKPDKMSNVQELELLLSCVYKWRLTSGQVVESFFDFGSHNFGQFYISSQGGSACSEPTYHVIISTNSMKSQCSVERIMRCQDLTSPLSMIEDLVGARAIQHWILRDRQSKKLIQPGCRYIYHVK